MTEIEKELERLIESGKATTKVNSDRFQTTHIDPLKIAKHFTQWQKEQMMKDAEQIRFDCSLPCKTFNNLKAKGIEIGDKLLIIKE